jgi:cytochrome c peroxidase
VDAIGKAIEAYLTAPEMAPFSSRFDDVVRGRGALTAEEREGLRLFKDPAKGNCASCHTVNEGVPDPAASLFTDFGYDAVAVPRNERVHPAAKPDLGLCERTATETPSSEDTYCINFRTPSLRNVAARASFMHNGAFHDLRDVVAFYASRDTAPRRWYRSGVKFDSVPRKFRGQVNVTLAPYGRRQGEPPALTDPEIDAIVAFLRTLTDGAP